MKTATTATDRVLMSSRAKPDMKAVRRVVMVVVRYRSETPASAWRWVPARRRPTSTGSPRASSSTWWESRSSPAAACSTRSSVYWPMRIMKTGMSGRVRASTSAETQSWPRIHRPRTSGMIAAVSRAGRYCVKYLSSPSSPVEASTESSPAVSEPAPAAASRWATSRCRSSSLAPRAARRANTCCPQVATARATTPARPRAAAEARVDPASSEVSPWATGS